MWKKLKKLLQFESKKNNQTEELIQEIYLKIDHRLNELSAQIQELEFKLLNKDLRDKQQYGLLHYKIMEKKEEDATLEAKILAQKLKAKLSDH